MLITAISVAAMWSLSAQVNVGDNIKQRCASEEVQHQEGRERCLKPLTRAIFTGASKYKHAGDGAPCWRRKSKIALSAKRCYYTMRLSLSVGVDLRALNSAGGSYVLAIFITAISVAAMSYSQLLCTRKFSLGGNSLIH